MENKKRIEQGGIVVREVNSEILIFLDNNRSTRLDALREASKILQREVLREEAHIKQFDYPGNQSNSTSIDSF
jgi:hypothetical protein